MRLYLAPPVTQESVASTPRRTTLPARPPGRTRVPAPPSRTHVRVAYMPYVPLWDVPVCAALRRPHV